MGLFGNLIGNLAGNLAGSLGAKGLDWEEQMTEEQIDELEKQGCDVTELRAKLAQKQAGQQAAKEDRAASIHLEKLDAYKSTPRSADTPFFTDIAGKPPLIGKDKWLDKFQNAELIYAAIVQANSDLWEPGSGEYLPAVVVFTNDPTLRYNAEWLLQTAEKVSAMAGGNDVPKDCKGLIKDLRDEESSFFHKIGDSITGGVTAWCQTFDFPKQSNLPNSCLPTNKILPFLLFGNGADVVGLIEIPGKYYM